LVAVSAAVAFPVFASSEGVEEGWGWLGTVGRWTNLLVLFGLVFYFVRRPIGRFFRERRAGIRKEIEEAAADHQQVREQTLAVEERLRRLDEELAEIRRTAEREAEAERQRVIEQARLDADRILENARQEVGMLTRAAQKQLREYAARLSVDIAEARIRREVTPDDERRVVDRFLNDLAGGTEK
jgi:F-type H+-transporting ATPase subunit b